MQQIVECVPNFSEGRRSDVIEAIADAVRSVPGIHLLDSSADADHNRTVLTFVGAPEAVEEAAFRAIGEAAKHINLDHHEGEHPRIGATDVCPLIPVKNVSIDECIEIAQRLGRRVGEELGVAVYLYGSAATRADRVKLVDIRRGEYESWREEVGIKDERQPDFGPAEPKPWGATVIGVRPFLIAYNIYLNTDNVDQAKAIARAVRFSSGGLRYLQAMGFLVGGQAQVSMNLTDFTRTPIYRVQEIVRKEAARYGLSITHAELVGLAPQKALQDTAQWYLQIDDFRDEQVLENRIAEEAAHDYLPYLFLDQLAAASPTPGGGSAAALSGALGSALVEMVAHLTIGRKRYVEFAAEAEMILVEAKQIRSELTLLISEDAEAFDKVMEAWRNKTWNPEQKEAEIEAATTRAGEIPLKTARLGLQAARLAAVLVELGNVNAISDAAAAGLLANAAVQAAGFNVRINAKELKDQALAAAWLEELAKLEREVTEIVERLVLITKERSGI